MAKLFTALIFAVFQFVGSSPLQAQSSQEIVFRLPGINITFDESQPNLSLLSVSNVCNTGVWVTYTGQRYTYGSEGILLIQIYPDIEPACTEAGASNTGSTRYFGNLNNPSATSVTLCSQTTLRGEDVIEFEDEIENIPFSVGSLVTIGTSVEFFQERNFGGNSLCLEIDPFFCRGEACWLWDLFDMDLPWDVSAARSARTGCLPTTKVYHANNKNDIDPTIVKKHMI